MNLHEAIVGEDMEAFHALISAGADVNARAQVSEISPLHIAAFNAQTEMVSRLFDRGASGLAGTRKPRWK